MGLRKYVRDLWAFQIVKGSLPSLCWPNVVRGATTRTLSVDTGRRRKMQALCPKISRIDPEPQKVVTFGTAGDARAAEDHQVVQFLISSRP